MASPQCEHGFTRIANELLDAFLAAGRLLTKREAMVWLAILRLTYGFNKKADFIPVRRIERMTGIRFDHVHETVWRLKRRGLIHLEKRDGRLFAGINKDYSRWFQAKGRKPAPSGRKKGAVTQGGNVPKTGNCEGAGVLPKPGTGQLPNMGNRSVTQKGDIKRQKTSIKKSSSSAEGQGAFGPGEKAGSRQEEEEVFRQWRMVFGTGLPERLKEKARRLLNEIQAGRIEPGKIRFPIRYLEAFEPPRKGLKPSVSIAPGMKVSYRGRIFEISDGPCIFMEDGLMVEGTIRRLIQLGNMKIVAGKGGTK